MAFQMPLAFGIAAGVIGILATMSVFNRRSGWRRERSDNLLEILTAWAAAKTETRAVAASTSPMPAARQMPVPQADPIPSMGLQLSALHSALEPHKGVRPQPNAAPVVQAEQTQSEANARR